VHYTNNKIKPDGGILFLIERSLDGEIVRKKPLLISEIKRQGTNDEREAEGKKKQAQGNAIERLGKNLTGIKTMMNYEKITPFVCFGWGCDFALDSKTVLAKVSMMNEFYPLNKLYVFKKDGGADFNSYSPVSMYFREEAWTIDEMFSVMKEIAETAFRYYKY
jgi:type II restriction enzyme